MFLKENEASIIETTVYVSKIMIYKIALLSKEYKTGFKYSSSFKGV